MKCASGLRNLACAGHERGLCLQARAQQDESELYGKHFPHLLYLHRGMNSSVFYMHSHYQAILQFTFLMSSPVILALACL